jgi:polyhydroxyalkanoate synthesis regulator phasin
MSELVKGGILTQEQADALSKDFPQRFQFQKGKGYKGGKGFMKGNIQ